MAMAEEEFIPYKDISELNKELQGMGRKDISNKELHEAVQRLTQTISGMLEVFGAAAEQMKLEEREYEMEARKHEMIASKLDKVIEQNRTIAEAMVGIVDMVKERIVAPAKERDEMPKPREESLFKPKPFMEPRPFKADGMAAKARACAKNAADDGAAFNAAGNASCRSANGSTA